MALPLPNPGGRLPRGRPASSRLAALLVLGAVAGCDATNPTGPSAPSASEVDAAGGGGPAGPQSIPERFRVKREVTAPEAAAEGQPAAGAEPAADVPPVPDGADAPMEAPAPRPG